MAVLYEDKHLVCDDDAITIKRYYFPIGSKRIPYRDIRGVSEEPLTWRNGRHRIWGMGPSPTWFHLDVERPSKKRRITIDQGSFPHIAITPTDHDAVLAILRARTARS